MKKSILSFSTIKFDDNNSYILSHQDIILGSHVKKCLFPINEKLIINDKSIILEPFDVTYKKCLLFIDN